MCWLKIYMSLLWLKCVAFITLRGHKRADMYCKFGRERIDAANEAIHKHDVAKYCGNLYMGSYMLMSGYALDEKIKRRKHPKP